MSIYFFGEPQHPPLLLNMDNAYSHVRCFARVLYSLPDLFVCFQVALPLLGDMGALLKVIVFSGSLLSADSWQNHRGNQFCSIDANLLLPIEPNFYVSPLLFWFTT